MVDNAIPKIETLIDGSNIKISKITVDEHLNQGEIDIILKHKDHIESIEYIDNFLSNNIKKINIDTIVLMLSNLKKKINLNISEEELYSYKEEIIRNYSNHYQMHFIDEIDRIYKL